MQQEAVAGWIRLDFEQARAKHLLFKSRLRAILYGLDVDEAPVVSHHECSVGKWIYGHALESYAHIPKVHQLERVHKELHAVAAKLVALYKEGKVLEARTGLEEMEFIADDLIGILSVVEDQVQHSAIAIPDNQNTSDALAINLQEFQELHRLNKELDGRIRKQSQELTQANERFELVAKATHDAVWDWNLVTNEIWWNEGFRALFGYSEEEIEPTIDSWYNRVHPDDKDRVVGGIHVVIDAGGKNWSDEYRFRRKDGSYATVLDRGYALHDESGKPYRMLGSMQDISERRKQEEEIQAQHELIRTMAENATSTLFMMNAKGYCTFMNKAGEKMFGYSQEEIRSKPLHYLIHHHRPDGSPYPMEECPLDRALPENFDVRAHKDHFFRKDGTSLQVSCAASPIFEGSVPVATVIEVRDITLEIEAEQALRRSAQELEQLVEERTRELRQVNEQLIQFSYSASHDLQEPLRKISFFTEKLLTNLDADLSEENTRIAGRIVDTTKRMRTLIDDLLNYSNATLGAIGFTEVGLNQTVESVLSDIEASVIEKGASIQFEGLPTVKGDQRQLRQLFQNLISNALKYQKVGVVPEVVIASQVVDGNTIEANIPAEFKRNKYYLVQVQDNGIGFDPDDAERIFKLFQRLHGKAEYDGTGVGLAIVQKVVENHEGYIWAESEPGVGATFKMLLPVA
jgi:PAS domain S-box-containing protein